MVYFSLLFLLIPFQFLLFSCNFSFPHPSWLVLVLCLGLRGGHLSLIFPSKNAVPSQSLSYDIVNPPGAQKNIIHIWCTFYTSSLLIWSVHLIFSVRWSWKLYAFRISFSCVPWFWNKVRPSHAKFSHYYFFCNIVFVVQSSGFFFVMNGIFSPSENVCLRMFLPLEAQCSNDFNAHAFTVALRWNRHTIWADFVSAF